MSMDLIISEKGDVMIASNLPFPAEPVRVDFFPGSKLLTLNYRGQEPEGAPLNLEVHDRMMSALLGAPSALLVFFRDGGVEEGFDVPLVQVDIDFE